MFDKLKHDSRPKRGAWAPGEYFHSECVGCREPFQGDKRALECADCAYSVKPEPKQIFDERASFTVPASGRRYTIHVEDWESIKLHMEVAAAARAQAQNDPPSTTTV